MDGGAAKKGYVKPVVARGVALLACVVLAVGCSRGEQGLVLGYGDFVCLDGITYEAIRLQAGGDTAEQVDRSSAYARTEVKLQGGDDPRPEERSVDVVAGQLEPGTPLYRLEGNDPDSRLAARINGGWQVYDARIKHETGAVPCSRG